jgi:MFS family permease
MLRVLLGVGEAPFYPSGIRSTREWFSAETRGRATAVMSSSQTIGLSFAPPVLTWIMLQMGWRGMFIVLGAAGLVVAAAWIALHVRARQLWEPEEVQIASRLVSRPESADSPAAVGG